MLDTKKFIKAEVQEELIEHFMPLYEVKEKTIAKIMRLLAMTEVLHSNDAHSCRDMNEKITKLYDGMTKKEVFHLATFFQRYVHLNYVYNASSAIRWVF